MKRFLCVLAAAVMCVTAAGCGADTNGAEEPAQQEEGKEQTAAAVTQLAEPEEGEEIAVITTSKGVMKMRFFPEAAPKAVENFKTLAADGYYDGLTFHRVIQDFMVQTGDPEGTGAGGQSCWGKEFEDEFSKDLHFYRGAVAMANRGPNTNGSQFFVVHERQVQEEIAQAMEEVQDKQDKVEILGQEYTLAELFPKEVTDTYREKGGSAELEYAVSGAVYTIFGQVFDGFDALDAIAAAETDEGDKPLEAITIDKIELVPYAAE